MRFSSTNNRDQRSPARRLKKHKLLPLPVAANVAKFRTQESSTASDSCLSVKTKLESEATAEQLIQVNVTINLSVPSTILCNLSTEMMETSIRFGLTDSIQASISHGIQADLIRKIFEQVSAVSADSTAMEDISPENRVPIIRQSGDEATLEPSIETEEKFMGLQVTDKGNTVTTLYCDENQVSLSSPPRSPPTSSKYESESEQEGSITLSSSDPVQTHVFDASSFSSSSVTYHITPSFYHSSVETVPTNSLPPQTVIPPGTQETDGTELDASTVLPMHHLPSGKWLVSPQPQSTLPSRAMIQVHLHDDPDSPSKNIETWHVKPQLKNIFKKELWNAGYRWCLDSNDSVTFVSRYQIFSWEVLEPFTVKEGRKAKPLLLFRRPAGRLDFLLGTGVGFLLHLVSFILFMWQPWRADLSGSSHAFFSNFLPMLAQWWTRVEMKRSGDRIIDPYLNSIYKLNPRGLLY
ncbi:hypothetical protein E4T56_gene4583 [Termitomyces sp. T112]|nr:hypothetical protein E4T56_gene4583 [Termitomyces sp. T112]KNZ71739.1 hypothetical protein J132_07334 [Termitomyces sp. J132]